MKVIIYADGGSRGNPGIAGSGTVVYSADTQETLREIVYVVGTKATNNVAEYHGLIKGLEAAKELGASELEIYMDSKLVVEQANGRWKAKHPDMKELVEQAKSLLQGFDSFTLSWVPRNKNKVADKLSNDAMDAAAQGHPVGTVGGVDEEPQSNADSSDAESVENSSAPGDWFAERCELTQFVLLRHGQTQMSADKVYSGRRDVPLTEFGQQQALAAAQTLADRFGSGDDCSVDAIVSSPLRRCQQTAAAAAKTLGREVEVVEDLIELDFGDWEGLSFTQAQQQNGQLHSEWLNDVSVPCPEGESLQDLHRRVRKVRKLLQEKFAGQRVLVVSHVNPIKSFLRQGLDAGPMTFNRIFLDLASLSEVEFWKEGSVVRRMNDVGHLQALR